MTLFWRNRTAAAAAAEKLKAYAHPLRLMILSCLLDAERNVSEIAEATGIVQPALSQQLAELRRADLVRTRKEVKQVWYSLADDRVRQCTSNIEAIFGGVDTPELSPRTASPQERGVPERRVPQGVAGFASIL